MAKPRGDEHRRHHDLSQLAIPMLRSSEATSTAATTTFPSEPNRHSCQQAIPMLRSSEARKTAATTTSPSEPNHHSNPQAIPMLRSSEARKTAADYVGGAGFSGGGWG